MLLKNIQSAEADLNLSRLLAEETETGNESLESLSDRGKND